MTVTFKVLLAACILGLFGCSHSSDSTTNSGGNGGGIPANAGPGEIGFLYNGHQVIRHAHIAGTYGTALLSANSGPHIPPGSILLEISMQLAKGVRPVNVLSMYLTIMTPSVGTYTTASSDSIGAWITMDFDSSGEGAIPGSGVVNIVKFDTVNNVVSGTFHFLANNSNTNSPTDTITEGYFNDLPITMGCYDQGTIGATAYGVSFVSADTGFQTAWGFQSPGSPILVLNSDSKDAQGVLRGFSIHLNNPQVGIFPLGSAASSSAYYSESNGTSGHSISTSSAGSSGMVTITKFDPVAQRISGTFQFTAPDDSNKVTAVTNGSINNVHYVEY